MASLLLSLSLQAQVYVAPRIGYSLGLANQVLGFEVDGTRQIQHTGTLGQGFNGGIALGVMVTDNIGIELGAAYFLGAERQLVTQSGPEATNAFAQTQQLRITPALLLTTGSEGPAPYLRLGALLPVTGKTSLRQESGNTVSEAEFVGRFSVGLDAALGVSIPLSDQLSVFAELNFISLNILRRSSEVVRYEVGGQDFLDQLPDTQRNVEYVDEVDLATPVPGEQLTTSSPYSSSGLNLGVKIHLN
jgi:opacity protein-like surface antigen